ncbi:MAG: hypothetical protein JWO98_2406 [Frankiales bacterium]|nr:hypothetical protein [Frankiales bacterium]
MTISVLDVRDTFVPPRVRLPEPALRPLPERPVDLECTAVPAPLRRPPAPVVVAAVAGVVEAVALVAAALTVLAGLLGSGHRPSGLALGAALVGLATWVVLAASSGAVLLDGAGRRLYDVLACVELALVVALLAAATLTPLLDRLWVGVPFPALALSLLTVPAGKLLLAGASSTGVWLAQGPRVRVRRPDPAAAHRGLCAATLGLIAVALTAVAVLVPAPASGAATAPSAVSAH